MARMRMVGTKGHSGRTRGSTSITWTKAMLRDVRRLPVAVFRQRYPGPSTRSIHAKRSTMRQQHGVAARVRRPVKWRGTHRTLNVLLEAITQRRLSIPQVAAAASISPTAARRLVMAMGNPDWETVAAVTEAFGYRVRLKRRRHEPSDVTRLVHLLAALRDLREADPRSLSAIATACDVSYPQVWTLLAGPGRSLRWSTAYRIVGAFRATLTISPA